MTFGKIWFWFQFKILVAKSGFESLHLTQRMHRFLTRVEMNRFTSKNINTRFLYTV